MKIILKRFCNTLSVLITIGLIFSIFNDANQAELFICGFFYALVLACNYILLGALTLWHKSEDI
jgi:hypothetical protein